MPDNDWRLVDAKLSVIAVIGLIAAAWWIRRRFPLESYGVLTFLLPARGQKPEERALFVQRMRDRLSTLPGVASVTAATSLPLDGTLANARYGREAALSDPSLYKQADVKAVLSNYFETLATPLIAGRTFTDADVGTYAIGLIPQMSKPRMSFSPPM